MKNLPVVLLFASAACGSDFEPDLSGWRAYNLPGRHLVHLEINGREKMISLPGNDSIGYRFPQWTRSGSQILIAQTTRNPVCQDWRILSVDTTGLITDTIYKAHPNTALNFKLAPNDTVLLLKTYADNCEETDQFRYSFYDRFSKKPIGDTVVVGNSKGILLTENVWSPDSRKVIISEWSGLVAQAYAYDLVTKDTTYIGIGSNFIWSPADNNLVAYIKDFSIHTLNVATGDREVLLEGKRKKGVIAFRWNPSGNFLMIHMKSYLLNIEAPPLQATRIIYMSMEDRQESRQYFDDQRIETWIDVPGSKF